MELKDQFAVITGAKANPKSGKASEIATIALFLASEHPPILTV